jgi:hypothetical protein
MMQKKTNKPAGVKKPGLSSQQRAQRTQSLLFGAVAIIMILSMILALVAK